MTFDFFVKEATKVHGDKYFYNESYFNAPDEKRRIIITCKKHGEFKMTPYNHLAGQICHFCREENRKFYKLETFEEFLNKAKKMHGDKYIYPPQEYKGSHHKVNIICPKHGEFKQTAIKHYNGQGCPKCSYEKRASDKVSTFENVVERCNSKHLNKYIYDKDTYLNCYTPFKITCPVHGEFWQTPNNHLQGHGCPRCSNSLLENDVCGLLQENEIKFIDKANKNVIPWIGRQHLDFFLPEYDIAIECQGGQHFYPVEYFGGENGFLKTKKADVNKKHLCEKHGIKLIYYTHEKEETFLGEKLIKNKNDLIKIIKDGKKGQETWQK